MFADIFFMRTLPVSCPHSHTLTRIDPSSAKLIRPRLTRIEIEHMSVLNFTLRKHFYLVCTGDLQTFHSRFIVVTYSSMLLTLHFHALQVYN